MLHRQPVFYTQTVTETTKTDFITAYCDGGSRGNPGPAGYGVSIENAAGHPVAELSEFLGVKTNNFAEYSGLLASLEYALTHGYARLRVIADSELMVKQMKGQYRVNSPDLRPLWEEAKRRAGRLETFEIQHVLRGKNKRADALANQAMDRGTGRMVKDVVSASGPRATQPAEKPRALKGFVKNGVVHLLEGELPENCFVRVTVE